MVKTEFEQTKENDDLFLFNLIHLFFCSIKFNIL